jgi:hypothetical protein
MDENVFISMSIEQRREYCRMKISEHSPPESPHDEFMIKVYKGLLDLHDDPDESDNMTEHDFPLSIGKDSD